MYDKVRECLDNDGVVCCGSMLKSQESKGVYGGHAYTVTGTKLIEELNAR